MARVPRRLTIFANHSIHKVWRGHNREWNLKTADEKDFYLKVFNEDCDSDRYVQGSTLQAMTVMSNHTHEVFFISEPKRFSCQMRRHHARYGQFFNRKHKRCGKVAQDRAFTTLLEGDDSQMRTVFYIHANPIRAKLVKDARSYYWSTHRLYAFGQRLPWMKHVVLPDWYKRLGKNPLTRQKKYRKLFFRYLKEEGRKKQTFLKRRFFGSQIWMKNLEDAVTQWRKEQDKSQLVANSTAPP